MSAKYGPIGRGSATVNPISTVVEWADNVTIAQLRSGSFLKRVSDDMHIRIHHWKSMLVRFQKRTALRSRPARN